MKSSNLPSKQFIIRGSIATAVVAILLIVQTDWFRGLFNKNPLPKITDSDAKVSDVLSKDTNGNGIPDWEEELWGLDPAALYTNGTPNKELILQKKKALGMQPNTFSGTMNTTDAVAQQLYTITSALGQSEEIDTETLKRVAETVGDGTAIEQISNHYSIDALTIVPTTITSLTNYHSAMSATIATFNTENDDIARVISALETGDMTQIETLTTTSTEYRRIAQSIRAIPVPVGIAQYHLNILNGFYGIADSFSVISKLTNNSLSGLAGIAAYKKYNQLLEEALFEEHRYFIQYGIL